MFVKSRAMKPLIMRPRVSMFSISVPIPCPILLINTSLLWISQVPSELLSMLRLVNKSTIRRTDYGDLLLKKRSQMSQLLSEDHQRDKSVMRSTTRLWVLPLEFHGIDQS
jgi:hypothetical protein